MNVIWKTGTWPQEYRIFRDKVITGILKKNTWKAQAYGEFNGAMLRFRSEGFWKNKTIISDIEGTKDLGNIEYDSWKASGKVTFMDETYEWKYDSWKGNKWSIGNKNGSANYTVTNFWKGEGTIEFEDIPPAVVLTGLFIDDHFRALSAAV
ncbi:hypothetical protein DYBT9275_04693 [Dyadobacter sp. CECT 9275]|uniref:Uncharacterized protein n=1 Tax=Dyadobacter helix TaxID=2822344 RepID=A0A916JH57_9BACT|nr:hypothetical protein [Dyadobacter sp. CECT 9275]CAG5010327.1 hypothetical protein DYBT9275_04693 [Dyadobacter sp. CECT 9275]